MMLHKLLKSGLIYDGTGTNPYIADIRLSGNRIAEIAPSLSPIEEEECFFLNGLAVTPGFIDIHRHCDVNPLTSKEEGHPYGEVLLRQGITSVITGNCGISMYPTNHNPFIYKQMADYYSPVLGDITPYSYISDYRSYLEALNGSVLPVNTGAMIGMGAVRIAIKGFSKSAFTKQEIEQCKIIIEDALKRGAPGVSIGLMYLPECYETIEELGEILKPVGQYGKIVTAHIRGEGDSLVKSIAEVIQIGKIAGCKIEISHFKSCGVKNWGKEIFRAIQLIENARNEGMEVACDFYPYNCGSTTLMSMIPPAFVKDSISDALDSLHTEHGRKQLRQMLLETYPEWDNYALSLGWDKVILSAVSQEKNKPFLGKSISEIAQTLPYKDEVDVVSDLLTSENSTAAIIIRSMDQADVDTVAKLPYSCLISDAIYAQTDHPHPRMYGAFPKFIQEYVFSRNILSFSEAIYKMTGLPAKRMQIKNRGLIRKGYYADLNIFNPHSFISPASYTTPALLATGLHACFLNGELVVKDDQVLSLSNGKLLFS